MILLRNKLTLTFAYWSGVDFSRLFLRLDRARDSLRASQTRDWNPGNKWIKGLSHKQMVEHNFFVRTAIFHFIKKLVLLQRITQIFTRNIFFATLVWYTCLHIHQIDISVSNLLPMWKSMSIMYVILVPLFYSSKSATSSEVWPSAIDLCISP